MQQRTRVAAGVAIGAMAGSVGVAEAEIVLVEIAGTV